MYIVYVLIAVSTAYEDFDLLKSYKAYKVALL